jgi:uncharacterized protein (DUF488 family)
VRKAAGPELTGLVGVGYQGCEIDSFVAALINDGVTRVVDVRLTPISRKPGFSKTKLAHALSEAGIGYEHRPELGNPRHNRAGFAGSPSQLGVARDTFAALLRRPEAEHALDAVAQVAQRERVAVLCFEVEQRLCHRDVVLAEIARRAITSFSSGNTRRAR